MRVVYDKLYLWTLSFEQNFRRTIHRDSQNKREIDKEREREREKEKRDSDGVKESGPLKIYARKVCENKDIVK